MLKILITDEHIRRAKKHYDNFKCKHSIREGSSGKLVGAIGEIIAYDYFGYLGLDIAWSGDDFKDYDISVNRFRVEVKTGETTVQPKPHYNCIVAATSMHQKCDAYVFLRVDQANYTAYILGYIRKSEFEKNSTFVKEGTIEGKFVFKADSYIIQINKLNKLKLKGK